MENRIKDAEQHGLLLLASLHEVGYKGTKRKLKKLIYATLDALEQNYQQPGCDKLTEILAAILFYYFNIAAEKGIVHRLKVPPNQDAIFKTVYTRLQERGESFKHNE